jgi:peptidoglycan hydrolase CwlO-like protein
MKKHGVALLVAFVISLIVGVGMFVIGGNAAMNPNGVPASNSPASANALAAGPGAQTSQSQIDQLQGLVAQYQGREQQYQQREQQYQNQLSSVQQQLDQANAAIQQYQQVLVYLQQLGIIQVDRSGRILLPGGGD